MNLNVFAWLRRRVAQAILEGVQDGLEALDAGHAGQLPPPLALPEALRARLVAPAPGLPEEPEEASNGRRKRA